MDTSSDKLTKSHKKKNLDTGNFRKETKSLLIIAQINAITTDYVKAKIGYDIAASVLCVVIEKKRLIT